MNNLAIQLNSDLGSVASFLSRSGSRMYFPYGGILGQSAEAKACRLNATIGMAFEEDGSPLVMECFSRNLNVGKKAFLYAGSFGNPDLRRIWKEKQIEKNPSLKGIKFSLPVVTNAITHSLRVAAELFSDESATLVVPDLYWDNYDLVFVESTGCGKRMFNTFKNGSFDSAAMKEALLSEGEKKILILNFPNNPTGYTATLEDAAKIVSAVKSAAQKGKKVTVVLDDAYFGLVYEKGIHCESLFSEFAGLHKNVLAVKVDGLTKEDYAWGLRVGFISFAFKGATDRQLAALEAKAAGSVRGSISNVTSVGQALAVEAFGDRKYRAQKREKYNILKRRYDEIRRIFSKRDFSAQFEPMPFNSGYFMCIKPNGVDPEELRRHLIEKYSLGTIVLSGLVRLAFSTVPRASLKKMFHDIASAVDDLKKR